MVKIFLFLVNYGFFIIYFFSLYNRNWWNYSNRLSKLQRKIDGTSKITACDVYYDILSAAKNANFSDIELSGWFYDAGINDQGQRIFVINGSVAVSLNCEARHLLEYAVLKLDMYTTKPFVVVYVNTGVKWNEFINIVYLISLYQTLAPR